MTKEVIFIRVIGVPGPTWRAKKARNSDIYLIRVYVEPGILPLNIRWGLHSLLTFTALSQLVKLVPLISSGST
jgi:hypothetical protein